RTDEWLQLLAQIDGKLNPLLASFRGPTLPRMLVSNSVLSLQFKRVLETAYAPGWAKVNRRLEGLSEALKKQSRDFLDDRLYIIVAIALAAVSTIFLLPVVGQRAFWTTLSVTWILLLIWFDLVKESWLRWALLSIAAGLVLIGTLGF